MSGAALAYVDGIGCRSGDFLLMKHAADRAGLEVLTVFDGDATCFFGPQSREELVRTLQGATGGIAGVVTLIVPGLDHLGEHLSPVRRHVAVLAADTGQRFERTGAWESVR